VPSEHKLVVALWIVLTTLSFAVASVNAVRFLKHHDEPNGRVWRLILVLSSAAFVVCLGTLLMIIFWR
jgi:uncharacterized membrane protein YoaK (UPF0700 family)